MKNLNQKALKEAADIISFDFHKPMHIARLVLQTYMEAVEDYGVNPNPYSWQDMKTAPRDGTYILLCFGEGYYQYKAWNKKRKAWVDFPDGDVDYDNKIEPIKWMQLPK